MFSRFLAIAIAFAIFAASSYAADSGKLDKPKEGWAKVPTPHGMVWLNPGDAYEHDTGLVRDAYGNKRLPTTPSSVHQQPTYSPFNQPAPVYQPQPAYQPQPIYHPQPVFPPQPVFQPPMVNPYFNPTPYYNRNPYYQPYYDTGPYLPDGSCPTCPPLPRSPSSQSWGLGQIDPMDVPKTGDGPLRQ